ncbi:hypothetical protein [Dactylosporangium sp. CA-139066]|uniref:hypothetical protein n=1 Tax=Dactylosporangium sp. CA-139066 TaxID=3239930 RepID=UPI003D93C3DB
MRRVALLVVVGVVAGLSGCTAEKSPEPQTPRSGVVASPTGLAADVQAFVGGSYRFKVVANEGTYVGGIDPVGDVLDASVSVKSGEQSIKIDTVQVHGVAYTRLGTAQPVPGLSGDAWYRVDPSRVSRAGALGLSAIKDPTGVRALIAATHDVRQDGRTFRGTVDMTRVAAWGPVNVGQVLQLGDAARAIPFEAAVDERERITSVKVSIPGNTVQATYSDFGAAVSVQEPANAAPLPDYLYGMLGL